MNGECRLVVDTGSQDLTVPMVKHLSASDLLPGVFSTPAVFVNGVQIFGYDSEGSHHVMQLLLASHLN